MTSWLGAILLVAGFLGFLKAFRLVERGRTSLQLVRDSLADLTDRTMDDEAKERAMRRYAVRLFGLFVVLTALGGVALFAPVGLLWVLDRIGWVRSGPILDTAMSWPFICVSGAAMVFVFWIASRRPPRASDASGFEIRYSAADRLLHQVAFATTPMQTALSSLEDRLYRRRLEVVRTGSPVFICGLPRAGTTLLLDLVAAQAGMVTHTYRDMPFIHVPLFWNGFARAFRTRDVPRERAHGDGMMVSLDSPEALEEALWIGFWPEHYEANRIRPWSTEEKNPEFVRFFVSHMRKLAASRGSQGDPRPFRYASKNNLNIARVGWLQASIPDARVLIPFREPVQHAASLLGQHRNFLEIHGRDDFARQYMGALGHFDFGANLRPVDFGGWYQPSRPEEALRIEFWLGYWIAAHRSLLAEAGPRVGLMSYDRFCAAPGDALARLADFLAIDEPAALLRMQSGIRPPRQHEVDSSAFDSRLLKEAEELHERLLAESLFG